MLRLHITLNMLDCLDDIVELVQDLPDSQKRGVDKVQLQLLSSAVYEKKLGIDRRTANVWIKDWLIYNDPITMEWKTNEDFNNQYRR